MPSTKEIQRRIKSIRNTKKITRAMEMVAAAKMRRSVEAVLKTRTYSNLSWATILNLAAAAKNDAVHPLLQKRKEVKRVAIILITSNRGMCGSLNSALINKAHKSIEKYQTKDGKNISGTDFILIGKKGEAVFRYFGYNISAQFPKEDIIDEIGEVIPVARLIIDDFLSGKYDKVMVAYTDFVSAIKQVPRIKQILPIEVESEDEYLGIIGGDTRVGLDKDFIKTKEVKHAKDDKYSFEYTFEPSPSEVLNEMIPRLLEIQLYQAVLESNASEHSARMAAMHQATEAATDMVGELTLFYNKARQAAITNEIAEISAGANALAQ